ncbi:MAG: DUF3990 domain-containing protein [Muribaculaceae bacterium]|nr:DUF3990 domain-containing protein [Muribaculaceae bacterium]
MELYDVLTVYHGGTDIIPSPKVDYGRLNLDFGPGFYVTAIYSQAKDWANNISANRREAPCVNIYHLKQRELLKNCTSRIFQQYDREWLEFVTLSRLGEKPWQGLDYIEGGVADDRVIDTVRLFMTGFISAEDALKRLKYFKPTNQICLLNQEIVDKYLEFIDCKNISPDE